MPEKNAQMQRQQNAADAQKKREEAARAAAQIAESKSDKLLPFLNAARDRSTSRMDTLNGKKAVRQQKIERNETKIERLSTKAERLSVTNEMLHRLTTGTKLEAAANAIIARNQARIDKIRECKIPKCEEKIANHQERIAKLDKRIAAQQRKIDKCTALSNVITSFAIMDPDKRRAQFSQNMDTLHRVTKETLEAKIDKCQDRNTALLRKLQDDRTTPAQAERIGQKLTKNLEVLHDAEAKLQKLNALTQPYADQPAAAQDIVQTQTEQQLDAAAQSGEVRINPLTETICVGAAERAIERDAVQHDAAEQGHTSHTATLSQSREQSKGFVLSRQKRAEIAGKAVQAQHQPAKTDGQTQQHELV